MPDFIANAPELQIGLQLYMQAFFDLDTERPHSPGVALIPWSAIRDYGLSIGLDEEQQADLMFLIRQMDITHTDAIRKKQNG